jgi:hypothetical protein
MLTVQEVPDPFRRFVPETVTRPLTHTLALTLHFGLYAEVFQGSILHVTSVYYEDRKGIRFDVVRIINTSVSEKFCAAIFRVSLVPPPNSCQHSEHVRVHYTD